eukprot:TRINITY_DN5120_c0_g1_i4.p1 TRINITY_DN5120_c0_g1~~TRINITY_DN5120_c0_g1_i4.p1  ORF type:complete len:984 (+),score=190.33 TRINITY_DN5120_c0_g1_i4:65-3016(+)
MSGFSEDRSLIPLSSDAVPPPPTPDKLVLTTILETESTTQSLTESERDAIVAACGDSTTNIAKHVFGQADTLAPPPYPFVPTLSNVSIVPLSSIPMLEPPVSPPPPPPLPPSSLAQRIRALIISIYTRANNLPITIFYKYLWVNNKRLLVKSLAVYYILPILLEMLPWWASRRKIGNFLRESKVKLNHNMVTGRSLNIQLIRNYLLLTLVHSIIDTVTRHINARLAAQNKLVVRRLVMERLLYSELPAFEKLTTRGRSIAATDLEVRISSSIHHTLNFFNDNLPTIGASLYALLSEGSALVKAQRERRRRAVLGLGILGADTALLPIIDPLLIVHPIVTGLIKKISAILRSGIIDSKQKEFMSQQNTTMSRMVSNTLDGLADIQANNLQPVQLSLLDRMIADELVHSQGVASLVSRTWASLTNRSVIEFAAEVLVAHVVMQRRGMNNKEYKTMQLAIDRVVRLAQRTYRSAKGAKQLFAHQGKVMKFLNIPNFIEEDGHLQPVPPGPLQELRISNVVYAYKGSNPPTTAPAPSPLTTLPSSSSRDLHTSFPGIPTPILKGLSTPMMKTTRSFSLPGVSPFLSIADTLPALDLQGDMVIHPGRRYALIGPNRAGKSTLNHIICKFYTPTEGQITLDGIPYDEISRVSLRTAISYVSQRPFIFPGTIRDNIRVGNPDATEDEILAAAEAAGVFAFAEAAGVGMPADADDEQTVSGLPRSTSFMDWLHLSAWLPRSPKSNGPVPLDGESSAPDWLAMSQWGNGLGYPTPEKRSPSQSRANLQANAYDPAQMMPPSTPPSKLSTFWKGIKDAFTSELGVKSSKEDEKDKAPPPIVPPSSMPFSPHPILDHEIVARGNNVSGGFAQSIALARVFVRTTTKLVILDESMSQMDAYKKREIIFPRLYNFTRHFNMALLIVTHDLASIQDVDHIFVLDQGRLAAQGSHKELMDQKAEVYLRLLGCDSNGHATTTKDSPYISSVTWAGLGPF